jgi:hypothetical protein
VVPAVAGAEAVSAVAAGDSAEVLVEVAASAAAAQAAVGSRTGILARLVLWFGISVSIRIHEQTRWLSQLSTMH